MLRDEAKQADFEFGNHRLAQESERLDHLDLELRFYLRIGFLEASPLTPPVCMLAPHPLKVRKDVKRLKDHVDAEVAVGRR